MQESFSKGPDTQRSLKTIYLGLNGSEAQRFKWLLQGQIISGTTEIQMWLPEF
jgi:hypothetical protein